MEFGKGGDPLPPTYREIPGVDFAQAVAEEKKRIEKLIADLNAQKVDIDKQINSAQLELEAVRAYEATKQGKPLSRKRGTSVRAQILALIKSQPMTRAEVIIALGYQDQKGKQQTVSNSLSSLKAKGEITLKDGVYSV